MKVSSNWWSLEPKLGAYKPWYDLKYLKQMKLEGNYQKPLRSSLVLREILYFKGLWPPPYHRQTLK